MFTNRIRAAVALLLAFCINSSLTGCALFQKDDDADTSYERTRAAMESGGNRTDVRQAAYEEEERSGVRGLESLDPKNIVKGAKSLAGLGPDRELAEELKYEADQKFERAVAMYDDPSRSKEAAKLFKSAGETYRKAAARWPESSLEQEALFQAGEAFFFCDYYVEAGEAFELLVNQYPGSRYLDKAQSRRFTIAQYWLDAHRASPDNILTYRFNEHSRPTRDARGHAIRILDRMRIDDPTGKLADDATMALGNAYLADRRFLEAAETYEDLRLTFPTSQHQFDAHFFELKARLESYQGSSYDGTHLEKADKLLTSIMRQFPNEADQHREELGRTAAEVRYRLAEREYKMARYYDLTGHKRAATIYYQEVAEEYGDTSLADDSRERVAKIAEAPAKPAQRAAWLVNLFPESMETRPLLPTSSTQAALRQR